MEKIQKRYLLVRFRIEKDKLEKSKAAISEFVDAVKKHESDTLVYESFQESEDSCSFVHFMVFRDEMAQSTHRKSAYAKKFVEAIYPLCDGPPVFSALDLLQSNR